MEVQKNNLTKLCSFYVSDWHLVTMLLPYINQKINEQAKIATILEKNIKENVVTLVKKLKLKNEEKILNLNWNKNDDIKRDIKRIKDEKQLVIFINGSKKFIEKQNLKVMKYFEEHNIKQTVKIVNCYEVMEFNGSIQEILDEHDKILNTSGEKEIIEVFADYERSNNEDQKAVV